MNCVSLRAKNNAKLELLRILHKYNTIPKYTIKEKTVIVALIRMKDSSNRLCTFYKQISSLQQNSKKENFKTVNVSVNTVVSDLVKQNFPASSFASLLLNFIFINGYVEEKKKKKNHFYPLKSIPF